MLHDIFAFSLLFAGMFIGFDLKIALIKFAYGKDAVEKLKRGECICNDPNCPLKKKDVESE